MRTWLSSNIRSKKAILFVLILIVVLFLSSAIYVKLQSTLTFYSMDIDMYEGHLLCRDRAYILNILLAAFKLIAKPYIIEYIFPSFLLFMSIALVSLGLGKVGVSKFYVKRKYGYIFLLIVFAFILWVHFYVFLNFSFTVDEYSYCFQANLISAGKLYAKSPPMPYFFAEINTICDGKWYSKYTIGWPLLLALGNFVGAKFIINPILAVLSVYLVYLISLSLYEREDVALLGAFFVSVSPFFVFSGASYLSHTATGFFVLLYMYAIIKVLSMSKKDWQNRQSDVWANKLDLLREELYYSILAGISLMLATMVRPGEGAVVFSVSLVLWIYALIRAFVGRLRVLKKLVVMGIIIVIFFTLGLVILMGVNKCQTGDPFLFAFLKYNPKEKWGFGTMGHTPLIGLWNFIFSSMRNGMWCVPFLGVLSLLGVYRRRINLLLFSLVLGIWGFYFCYYSVASSFGARYHYIAFLIIGIISADGVDYLFELLEKICVGVRSSMLLVVVLCVLLFMGVGVYPKLSSYVHSKYIRRKNKFDSVNRFYLGGGKKIIFIKHIPEWGVVETRNRWDYWNEENLVVLFLMPKENREFMKKFPDRKPYCAILDPNKWVYIVKPYNFNDELPENYVFASANYGFDKYCKVEYALQKAVALSGRKDIYLYDLGYFYYQTGKYRKAIAILSEAVSKNPKIAPAYYYLGRSYGNLGRYKEACHFLAMYIKAPYKRRLSESLYNIGRAFEWYRYYRGFLK